MGEGAHKRRIVEHHVRIAADRQRALAGKHLKRLGRASTAGIDERTQIDLARHHPMGMHQIDPFLNGRDPVRNLRERLAAHFFLSTEIKRGMIGTDRRDRSARQSAPKCIVLLGIAQRGRHHKFGTFKAGSFGIGLIENQMRDHRLDRYVDASEAGFDGPRHRQLAGGMHDVDGCACQFGKSAEMVHAIGLHAPRTGGLVPLGAGLSLGKQFLLHRIDRFGVFAVGGDRDPEFAGKSHQRKEILVGNIECTLVGQKDLEGLHPCVGHQFADLLFGKCVESNHGQMEAEIATRSRSGQLLPLVKRGLGFIVRAGTNHLDHRRGSSGQCCLRGGGVVVDGVGSHEGQMNVHVRIDEPGKHIFADRIDFFGTL